MSYPVLLAGNLAIILLSIVGLWSGILLASDVAVLVVFVGLTMGLFNLFNEGE